ncbi:hypothetical protein AYI69_g10455 [Smittium culicis]|uniref:Uncharacterized protein n=1 Tax=Smittium culicis TaxID=133412 RepID=A0A1R1X5M5_9FUNG|nr:hypothetical protein AYI69_g10455 [Smittium culicis]
MNPPRERKIKEYTDEREGLAKVKFGDANFKRLLNSKSVSYIMKNLIKKKKPQILNEKDIKYKKEKDVVKSKVIEIENYNEEKLTQEGRVDNCKVKRDKFQFVPINDPGIGGDIKNFKIDIISDLNKVTIDTLNLTSMGSPISSSISSNESTYSLSKNRKKELTCTLGRRSLAKKKNFEIKNGGRYKGIRGIDPHIKTGLRIGNEKLYKEFENPDEMKKGKSNVVSIRNKKSFLKSEKPETTYKLNLSLVPLVKKDGVENEFVPVYGEDRVYSSRVCKEGNVYSTSSKGEMVPNTPVLQKINFFPSRDEKFVKKAKSFGRLNYEYSEASNISKVRTFHESSKINKFGIDNNKRFISLGDKMFRYTQISGAKKFEKISYVVDRNHGSKENVFGDHGSAIQTLNRVESKQFKYIVENQGTKITKQKILETTKKINKYLESKMALHQDLEKNPQESNSYKSDDIGPESKNTDDYDTSTEIDHCKKLGLITSTTINKQSNDESPGNYYGTYNNDSTYEYEPDSCDESKPGNSFSDLPSKITVIDRSEIELSRKPIIIAGKIEKKKLIGINKNVYVKKLRRYQKFAGIGRVDMISMNNINNTELRFRAYPISKRYRYETFRRRKILKWRKRKIDQYFIGKKMTKEGVNKHLMRRKKVKNALLGDANATNCIEKIKSPTLCQIDDLSEISRRLSDGETFCIKTKNFGLESMPEPKWLEKRSGFDSKKGLDIYNIRSEWNAASRKMDYNFSEDSISEIRIFPELISPMNFRDSDKLPSSYSMERPKNSTNSIQMRKEEGINSSNILRYKEIKSKVNSEYGYPPSGDHSKPNPRETKSSMSIKEGYIAKKKVPESINGSLSSDNESLAKLYERAIRIPSLIGKSLFNIKYKNSNVGQDSIGDSQNSKKLQNINKKVLKPKKSMMSFSEYLGNLEERTSLKTNYSDNVPSINKKKSSSYISSNPTVREQSSQRNVQKSYASTIYDGQIRSKVPPLQAVQKSRTSDGVTSLMYGHGYGHETLAFSPSMRPVSDLIFADTDTISVRSENAMNRVPNRHTSFYVEKQSRALREVKSFNFDNRSVAGSSTSSSAFRGNRKSMYAELIEFQKKKGNKVLREKEELLEIFENRRFLNSKNTKNYYGFELGGNGIGSGTKSFRNKGTFLTDMIPEKRKTKRYNDYINPLTSNKEHDKEYFEFVSRTDGKRSSVTGPNLSMGPRSQSALPISSMNFSHQYSNHSLHSPQYNPSIYSLGSPVYTNSDYKAQLYSPSIASSYISNYNLNYGSPLHSPNYNSQYFHTDPQKYTLKKAKSLISESTFLPPGMKPDHDLKTAYSFNSQYPEVNQNYYLRDPNYSSYYYENDTSFTVPPVPINSKVYKMYKR